MSFLFLRTLSDPLEFEHADLLAQVVLYFTVQFVYAVIAPITSIVLAFCFLFLGSAYRHQFVFIYPTRPDSGGMLWASFVKILLVCMLIAQVTIVGLLALKKSAIGVPLMIPLIVVTSLFSVYIHQQHFRAATYLPARACMQADLQNAHDMLDLSFLDGAFVQPELQTKEAFPEVDEDELPDILRNASFQFVTPPQSSGGQSKDRQDDDDAAGDTLTVASFLTDLLRPFDRSDTSS